MEVPGPRSWWVSNTFLGAQRASWLERALGNQSMGSRPVSCGPGPGRLHPCEMSGKDPKSQGTHQLAPQPRNADPVSGTGRASEHCLYSAAELTRKPSDGQKPAPFLPLLAPPSLAHVAPPPGAGVHGPRDRAGLPEQDVQTIPDGASWSPTFPLPLRVRGWTGWLETGGKHDGIPPPTTPPRWQD